ncbi:ATP-binding protein [Cuniculiplasma sp. SKW3]|uniref:ATP-binding protein n=1 Tax=Cuniculiplasma sp. SKW3 TaxID=3400170 RepID=UPI003FD595F3
MNNAEEAIDTISLQVAAQIIKHISAGLYRSPASSIKELLSNSYDADASNVLITFHFSYLRTELHLDKITIRDDGVGMSLDDLYYVFTHIGGSKKNTTNEINVTPKKKRKVVGRMGIGMLSVASACKGFVVRTKKSDQTREFIAKISLAFFDDIIRRNESMDKSKLGNVTLSSRHVGGYESYTEVEISDFKPPFLESIVPTIKESHVWKYQRDNLTDENYFEEFLDEVQRMHKLSLLPQMDKIIVDIGLMSPVEYLPDGPVKTKIKFRGKEFKIPGTNDPLYLEIKRSTKDLDFNVRVKFLIQTSDSEVKIRNEFKLFKPLLYPSLDDIEKYGFEDLDPYVYLLPQINKKVLSDEGNYENVTVKGFYYHQSKRVFPSEYSGLLFRLFNVALGNEFTDPMKFFVDTYMVQQQSIVEVFMDDGFQQIVNLDRESLYEGNNVYRFLKNYLTNHIRGDAPPKQDQSKTDPEKAIIETQFFKEQRAMFPENREGSIVSKIKHRRETYRKNKIKGRVEGVQQKILDEYDVEKIEFKRVHSMQEVGLYKESKTLIAKIPSFTKRKGLWDTLCVGLLYNLQNDQEKKEKIIQFVLNLYQEVEEGTKNEDQ